MALIIQLTENSAGIKLSLEKQRTTIGRDVNNDITLDDELVSKHHAVIEIISLDNGVEFLIQDLNSTNHTFVNDSPVELYKLKDKDLIRIGMSDFRFISQDPESMDETAQLYKTWIPGVFYTGKKKKKTGKKK
ncbi:MAG: FHA domain-containing protein [Gammaproteobacteria bacterium]|nr:FHA domain-containing protein [Gammaproteobacteria bacterium]MCW8988797.1 FHA domain-containing protein [Gammaproteobacteria bacterium]MCW9031759.1 FHA domain-containing protein [Gammaproteobacteria bacterium]